MKLKLKNLRRVEMWNDNNRFNQTGYSSRTVYPCQSNYSNMALYLEDLEKAKTRDACREDWLEELRMEAAEDRYYEEKEAREEYEDEE